MVTPFTPALRRILQTLVLLWALPGCFSPAVPEALPVACRDGGDCPTGLVCLSAVTPDGGRCVSATTPCLTVEGRDAVALTDGAPCGDGAICVAAACLAPRCGDGVVTVPETCDGGADCRADCSRCGDGILDSDEACDNGAQNSDVQPGACRTSCVLSACGDAVRDPGEACDDGPLNSDEVADACRTACARATCGDGVVDDGEECDDGALNSATATDACRPTCVLPTCGDGVVDAGEVCDDGALNSDVRADACRTTCLAPRCGDGVVDDGEGCDGGEACRSDCSRCGDGTLDAGEACDNGAQNSDVQPGACRTTCALASCGDAVRDPGEACDDGPLNNDLVADACRTVCARATCGDGAVDDGEACDDGAENSATAADACRPTCVAASCGDGVVDAGEVCDDGALNSDVRADACRTTCEAPRCGDGVVDDGEGCDGGPGCRADCSRCGDGVLDVGEACDTGAQNSDVLPGACRTTCALPACGDAVRDPGEACDEGPLNSDVVPDACRSDCDRATCGDRVVDATEVCDDGNTASGDGCRGDCQKIERCGDRVVDANERCDDGNDNDRDGCAGCQPQGWTRALVVSGTVEGGDATQTALHNPADVAIDALDRVIIVDEGPNRIRRLETDGTLITIAGNGLSGFTPDGVQATSASIDPRRVAVDTFGRVLFVDDVFRIRRIEFDGTLATIAGTGAGFSGDGGLATNAGMRPTDVEVDRLGRVLVLDGFEFQTQRIRRIDNAGIISTIATVSRVASLAVDDENRVLLAREFINRVDRLEPDGSVAPVAGNGTAGFSPDGTPALSAAVRSPEATFVDAQGRVVIVETGNHRVRRIEADGTLRTIAGRGFGSGTEDGVPATAATFSSSMVATLDRAGRVTIADTSNHRVRRVDTDGIIRTIAGNGAVGFVGAGAAATSAPLDRPSGVTVDREGRVIIADSQRHVIRRIEPNGIVSTIAGTGTAGSAPDGVLANQAPIGNPFALLIDTDGLVVFTDTGTGSLRRIEANGTLRTLASGLSFSQALALDSQGRIIIAETTGHRISRLELDGSLVTLAGTGEEVGPFDEGIPAVDAQLFFPQGIAVDDEDRVLLSDGQQRVCIIEHDGILNRIRSFFDPRAIGFDPSRNLLVVDGDLLVGADGTPVVGAGGAGMGGDGGPALVAVTNRPEAFAFDAEGRLILADTGNNAVRRVDLDGVITTIAGRVHPAGPGKSSVAQLYPTQALTVVDTLIVSVGDFGRAMGVDLDESRVSVLVGYEPTFFPSPDVQDRAAFSPLLADARGVAFDPVDPALFITQRTTGALRRIDLDVNDDRVIDDQALWTSSDIDAGLTGPAGIAYDPGHDDFVVVEEADHCVVRIGRDGVIRGAVFGRCGSPGAIDGLLNAPTHAVTSANEVVYVADTGNNRVLRVQGGNAEAILGDGSLSSAGEGAPARRFPVNAPRQLALDSLGNLFVTSTTAIRMVANSDGDSDVDGDDQVFTIFGSGDRDAYPESAAFCLHSLTITGGDRVFAADACQGFVVEVVPVTLP